MAKSNPVKVVMGGLRHVNLQTLNNPATTACAEAISNPAYLETNPNQRQGMLIERVRVMSNNASPIGIAVAATHELHTQIVTGDAEASPALVEPSDQSLVAQAHTTVVMATAVGFQTVQLFPIDLEAVMGTPLIVTPKFTVTHLFNSNSAQYNGKDIYTVIDYSIVSLSAEAFSTMLLNQSRTS